MTIRITFDSNNIDILIGRGGLDPDYGGTINRNRAFAGKTETIAQPMIWEGELEAQFGEEVYKDLIAWWSWARQGKTFSLAMDSANVVNTTLDGAAAAAQTTIPLTATAGLTVGDDCLIISANRLSFEVVTIDTINAGVSVVADANLKQAYASGDIFRHLEYFPSLVCLNDEFRPDVENLTYFYTFKLREAV
jgi:hypothetical protein